MERRTRDTCICQRLAWYETFAPTLILIPQQDPTRDLFLTGNCKHSFNPKSKQTGFCHEKNSINLNERLGEVSSEGMKFHWKTIQLRGTEKNLLQSHFFFM